LRAHITKCKDKKEKKSIVVLRDVIREALASMIILDKLAFSFVKGEGFKKFVVVSCPRFHISSQWIIIRDCFDLYLVEKIKLKNYLRSNGQRICLITDT
jgi:hypothetical protein